MDLVGSWDLLVVVRFVFRPTSKNVVGSRERGNEKSVVRVL